MIPPPPSLRRPTPIPMIEGMPAWWVLLGRWGMPKDVVVIDFETYFDATYKMGGNSEAALSTIEYVMDARFEEIGHSIVHVTSPFGPPAVTWWWGDDDSYIRHLQEEYGPNLEGCTTVAQNFAFDGTILVRKYGINPARAIDLLGLARHEDPRQRNDLGSMLDRHGLPPKGDTSQFAGFHRPPRWLTRETPKFPPCSPEKREQLNETHRIAGEMVKYGTGDGIGEWSLFQRLLPRLSNAPTELRLMQHTLELAWKPTLTVDQAAAVELTGKMQARVDGVVAATGHTAEEISGNKSFGVLLGTALDEAGDHLDKYQKTDKKGRAILAIAKTDEQLEVLKAHPAERVRQLIDARTAIKSWPNHISRVQRIARMARVAGDGLPVPLKYCGAHTGRASGGEKINLQNLGSRGDPLIKAVRHLIVPPEGYKLVIVDAAQIEARGCDWIAGEDVSMWEDPNRDPYCEFASGMSGREIANTKKRKGLLPAIKAYYDRMRGMGKVGVLGCGYGMGADKARDYASNSYGVDMTEGEALDLVKHYRETHRKVCKFWRMIEQKFKAAARYHEPGELDRGLKFHYEPEGDLTIITLPNSRTLKYPHVKLSIIDGKEQLWMPNPLKPGDRTFMWGGFLTENVVQAFCRDILMEAMLRLEDLGQHTALHIHDELVTVVKAEYAEACLKNANVEMARTPVWAPGLPLAAEGKISMRYEK